MEQRREDIPQSKSERYREILAVLARHGIGAVGNDAVRGEHLRVACEELGTTFIKLGQALATRGDLLPETYRAELLKLQDDVPPVPAAYVVQVILEDLGAPPDELFAAFDRTPIASASIGQVHAARLRDAREVIVKVRKPGVEQTIETDLEILSDLARTWSERLPALRPYGVPAMVREFGDTLRAELDYRREAANARYFREIFEKQRGFAIPEVIDSYVTERVIVLTRVDGTKPADAAALPRRRRSAVARRVGRFVLEPAFSHGIFHADPHGGNFLITAQGELAVMDFGMIGRLTPEARRRVADVFVAMERRDAVRLADRLIEITAPAHPIDRAALAAELDRMLARYIASTLDDLRFGAALADLLELIRRFGLRLPGNLALLFKALAMTEGLLETLDPDARLDDHLEPLANKLAYGRLSGDEWVDRVRDSAFDAAELSIELPRRVDRVLGEVERGNLRVWTRIDGVEDIVTRLEHSIERTNATMLACACIVGLAIVMLFYHPQGWERWIGVVFWIGVTVAFLAALRTVWGTLRKKTRDLR